MTMAKRSSISLLGTIIQMPPMAYVAITGRAPDWIRIWMIAFLGFWLLTLVVLASFNDSGGKP